MRRGSALIVFGAMLLTFFAAMLLLIEIVPNPTALGIALVLGAPTVGMGSLVLGLLQWLEARPRL